MAAARYYDDPRGSRLPALEQNILRYRAMEMVLALFYAEDLRRAIIGYVRNTDQIKAALGIKNRSHERVPAGTKKPLQKALSVLVADRALSKNEQVEIERLINFRNNIAHHLEELNADISPSKFATSYVQFRGASRPKYDYTAVERLQFYRQLLAERTRSKYVREISMAPLLFDAAERALKRGLRRLRQTIERQFAARDLECARLGTELSLDGTGLMGDLQPNHPYNKYEFANLTERGIEICYRLFDLGRSPMAVAHLMRISLRATVKRRKMWRTAGGNARAKRDVSTMKMRKFYRKDND